MLGVLGVQNEKGELGYLAAYSGSLPRGVGEGYFVPSIFHALDPQGWFKVKEAQISALNGNIEALEKSADYGEALDQIDFMWFHCMTYCYLSINKDKVNEQFQHQFHLHFLVFFQRTVFLFLS